MAARTDSEIDYLAIGHVTVDVILDAPGGARRQPGGGAFYSALQAARLGLRARVLCAGDPSELEALLAPYRDELEVEIEPATASTTLATEGSGAARRQRILAWAGPVPARSRLPSCRVLHLAPVARELASSYPAQASLVGLTPQGLLRSWKRIGGLLRESALAPEQLPERCDAAVLSAAERALCAPLFAWTGGAPVLAVTAGPDPMELRLATGRSRPVTPTPVRRLVDDLGAGDVFAAAFFVALERGREAGEAAAFASAAAAVRIEGLGPEAVGRPDAIASALER
ncbi:MAG: PfkB family carbohydrate kinase [Solirubrobacteraceae bacterium]